MEADPQTALYLMQNLLATAAQYSPEIPCSCLTAVFEKQLNFIVADFPFQSAVADILVTIFSKVIVGDQQIRRCNIVFSRNE